MTGADWAQCPRWSNGYMYTAPTVQQFTVHANNVFCLSRRARPINLANKNKSCFRSCLLRNKNKTLNFLESFIHFDECSTYKGHTDYDSEHLKNLHILVFLIAIKTLSSEIVAEKTF